MVKIIQIIKDISVEVSKPNLFQAIVAKQNDSNSRFLKITLLDEGEKINVSKGRTVAINAERKDGNSDSFFGEVNADGTVTVPLHSWMLELDGAVTCDVSVIDQENDRKLTSTNFVLMVEKAANSDEDISDDPQTSILISLIEEVENISAVKYNEAQNLTNEEKAQARENIGAVSADEITAGGGITADVLFESANGYIGTIMPYGSPYADPEYGTLAFNKLFDPKDYMFFRIEFAAYDPGDYSVWAPASSIIAVLTGGNLEGLGSSYYYHDDSGYTSGYYTHVWFYINGTNNVNDFGLEMRGHHSIEVANPTKVYKRAVTKIIGYK